jgi:hypothetical protein
LLPGRIDSTKVRKIVDADPDADITEYIDAANELVTEVCSGVKQDDGVTPYYSSHRLTVIEQWLAAHFYCIFDPRSQRERVAVLTYESQSKVGLALDVTHYGQQAKLLDTNGGLAALDAKAKATKTPIHVVAKVKWLGTKHCELPVREVC